MSIHDETNRINKQINDEIEGKPVSVALFGQPGSGKSSIINRLTGDNAAKVGAETDATQGSTPYEWQSLRLVDLPGFGTTMFPKETFFSRFDILNFDVFICVFAEKFRNEDGEFFRELRRSNKPCIFVRNKIDTLWQDGKSHDELRTVVTEDLRKHLDGEAPLVFVSCRTREGLDNLEFSILAQLTAAKQEKFLRAAKSYSVEFLQKKREACYKQIALYSALAAANGLNPIPGLDIGVDLGVMLRLFKKLREEFGLTDEVLKEVRNFSAGAATAAARVFEYGAKEGILALLKRPYIGREIVKEGSKWIPLVGQVVAASIGFGITYAAGTYYLNECYTLAEDVLKKELGRHDG